MTSADQASDEITQLRQLLSLLQTALEESRKENALLRQKIDALARRVFGSSSEQVDSKQLELMLQLASAAAAPAPAPSAVPTPVEAKQREPKAARAPRIPENLPVVEVIIDPQEVSQAPEEWRCIGQEVSEQLDFEPARFLRRRLIRKKYVHVKDEDRAPTIAALPEKLQERGLAAAGLLAYILISKYCDHLPLYRLEQIFSQRYKINLPRQTLARWVELCAEWLRPIYEQIRTGVLGGGYAQIDETPIAYLAPGHGQTKQGYLWTLAQPGGDVCYQWETSRAAECIERLIPATFEGVLQCDGYIAYRSFAQKREAINLAGCWAHVRRKFHEALVQAPKQAAWYLRQIQALYQIESRLRAQKAGPQLRTAVRSAESRMIVQRLGKALVRLRASRQHLPQSLLGQAIDYALGQWSTLEVFLTDGRVEIDNNLVENAIRPTAIGKKNWLFIGEAGAGQRGAVIYTLIESCRRRKIDPYGYLRDVLTRLPSATTSQVPGMLPGKWSAQATNAQNKP